MSTQQYTPIFAFTTDKAEKKSEEKDFDLDLSADRYGAVDLLKGTIAWQANDGTIESYELDEILIVEFKRKYTALASSNSKAIDLRAFLDYQFAHYAGNKNDFINILFDLIVDQPLSKIGLAWVEDKRAYLKTRENDLSKNAVYPFQKIWVSQKVKSNLLRLLINMEVISPLLEWHGKTGNVDELAGLYLVLQDKGYFKEKYKHKTVIGRTFYYFLYQGNPDFDPAVFRKLPASAKFYQDNIPSPEALEMLEPREK